MYGRQEQIESALARRHVKGEGYVLWTFHSSYVEGRCWQLAEIGYSRDGKPQISYELCCACRTGGWGSCPSWVPSTTSWANTAAEFALDSPGVSYDLGRAQELVVEFDE